MSQWWISTLVAFAVVTIIVAVIVVSRFTRMMRMKYTGPPQPQRKPEKEE